MTDNFIIKNKKFLEEKQNLLNELDAALKSNPNNHSLQSLKRILEIKKSTLELNHFFTRFVNESISVPECLGRKFIEFEEKFIDYSDLLISNDLKKLAKYLLKTGEQIYYFGPEKRKRQGNCIIFQTLLDLEKFFKIMDFGDNIEKITENWDIHYGGYHGFKDKETNEILTGCHPTQDPSNLPKNVILY